MRSRCIEGKVVTFYILFPVISESFFCGFLGAPWRDTETVLQEKDVKESVTLLVHTVYLASGPEWCQN